MAANYQAAKDLGMDDVLAAMKRLNDVRQMTNDKDQIAKAQKAVDDARAKAAAKRGQ